MREVDIRVVNNRKYDLNSYTDKARLNAIKLFEEYEHLLDKIEANKNYYNSASAFEDIEKFQHHVYEYSKLLKWKHQIELDLAELNDDYKNHKGLTFQKVYQPFVNFLSSEWYTLSLSILYVVLTIVCIAKEAPFYIIVLNVVLIALLILLFKYRRKQKRRKQYEAMFKQSRY
ncbi:hypothetical protein ABFV99_13970 [Cytobacillus horneckiae]|uniref:hypothetical protein n=1 Tax=Cytobacillus horneckiae TaxID=549687 RepID=UPI0034CE2D4A